MLYKQINNICSYKIENYFHPAIFNERCYDCIHKSNGDNSK